MFPIYFLNICVAKLLFMMLYWFYSSKIVWFVTINIFRLAFLSGIPIMTQVRNQILCYKGDLMFFMKGSSFYVNNLFDCLVKFLHYNFITGFIIQTRITGIWLKICLETSVPFLEIKKVVFSKWIGQHQWLQILFSFL